MATDEQSKRVLGKFPDLDDTTLMTFQDLRYIRMAMIEISARWFSTGIYLGVPPNSLDGIRSKNRNDSDRCLTSVIGEWLKNNEDCTWKKVVIAVSSKVGGDNPALASKIAREYKDYGTGSAVEGLENVDGTPLTSSSISRVTAALCEVPGKWDSVGIFLGIHYKVIEICRMEDTLVEKTTQMVTAWVNRKYEVDKFGEPSWRKLVEAVAEKSGGCHKRLAMKIAQDHPIGSSSEAQSDLQPIITTPRGTVRTTPIPSLPTEELSDADLPVLTNLLQSVAFKWEDICLQLGVPHSALLNIAANPMRINGAPMTFFKDGLHTWLQRGSKATPTTISALCKALESPTVAEIRLRYDVEEKLKLHKGFPSSED